MAILDLIATASDDTFAARVAMIQMGLAIDIMNEDPSATNHVNRLIFAQDMFKGLVNSKLIGAAAIAFNTTLQTTIQAAPEQHGATVTDTDLKFVLSGLFDNMANAYAATYQVPLAKYRTDITALAGGGQSGATPLLALQNVITTSASAGDSTILPLNFVGFEIMVCNLGVADAAVFADAGSSLNGTTDGFATLVPHSVGFFYCVAPATWISK